MSKVDGLPGFVLGVGKTPVPQLPVEDCKIIVGYILSDEAKSQGKGKPVVGAHISYQGRRTWWRGSDRVERVYASVRLLMYAGVSQAQACRYVAKLLAPKLGGSKRGRPRSGTQQNAAEPWQTVRSLFNSFSRRNPFPTDEDLAEFVDAITEKWFQYGMVRWHLESGRLAPSNCRPDARWPLPFSQK
jgi:hypothetical protein